MTTEMTDAQIDVLLRDDFEGAVRDEGFSARVMQVIPPRRPAMSWRRWPMPVAVGAGSLLTWLALLPAPLWQGAAQEWMARDFGGATVSLYALLLALGVLGCVWAVEESA